jgi:hypothetical protein
MSAQRVRLLVWLGIALSVGLYAVQAMAGRTAAADARLSAIGCLFKLAFQLTAAVVAWANAKRFEPGNPSGTGWRFLSLGMFAIFTGQLLYAPYQLRMRPTPFPSLADAFFVVSYPLLLVALASFLRAYTHAGLVPVPAAELKWLVALTVAVLVAVGFVVLRPVVQAPGGGLEYALNLVYPGSDLVLLVPTVLLFRFSLGLRGGRVWPVWLALLGGIVGMAAGDVAFSYVTNLGKTALQPLLHVMYLAGYGLIAQGALFQREILAD